MTRDSIERRDAPTTDLKAIYKQAALAANESDVKASDQDGLVAWIRAHCRYRPDTEFFLVLGIGAELADLQARAKGYTSEVDRAFQAAKAQLARRASIRHSGGH